MDLHLDLDGAGGLRAGLTRSLREAVRGGRLAPGTRLPSSRHLAADLGIARNTVVEAYGDLVAEGWLTARQGAATRVAEQHGAGAAPVPPKPVDRGQPAPPPVGRHDLRPGRPDVSSFPRAAWLAAARRAVSAAPAGSLAYGDPLGRPELRRALAGYLSRVRGVRTEAECVVVCAGFSEVLGVLGELIAAPIAVEAYGLWLHREALERGGVRTLPLPVDRHGACVGELAQTGARAVLLTPAHQFPTGAALHPGRRSAAVGWARAAGGLVLEDDYDGEFRYDRQPVGAVQGLDPDRVVYLGTASKALAPGLRLSWMAVPRRLLDAVRAVKRESRSSVLDQLTLADLLETGGYDRHVRAARLRYRRRRDLLVDTLARRAPDCRVSGIAAGLHAVVQLPPGTEQSVVAAARWREVELEGLGPYRHPDLPPDAGDPSLPRDALVVGYGAPTDRAFPGALDALCDVLPC
ncbi:PLP-dependent aminotransferase family protein [Streptomyces sp. XM4193]|uniref:MocR-like pyridoxine biosynthesis transcription factor PdxR n=1 Tax=Streptomyces sp. XM4193 TaxID=2929782 RepID=UPI001FFBAC0C|nr:PLP-dependent aminotransferase family protein [Streptomyces sp. XM4193]MCK1795545.1 PLP-dependent aminotransferase family protein [Streptomyces sp. XM4193]